MKKNFHENFQNIQVDPISGDYFVTIPEWIMSELSWYEDTEISLVLDGKDLILSEKTQD